MKKLIISSVICHRPFYLTFFFSLLWSGTCFSQNFLWAKNFGGNGFDSGSSIATDGSGNVYTTGYFQGTGDFDPGAGIFNLTCAGSSDIFISKLDASGNFLWAKRIGGVSGDEGYSIAADGSGNVYTTGYFEETVDFDPGTGIFNLTASGEDIFISKLDASGNFVWAKRIGGTGNGDAGFSIAVDGSGNVYTTGYFQGTADFDPGTGVFNLTSAGGQDIFISKLDASGNFLWAKNMGGGAGDIGYSIAVDGSENVYTTGSFVGAGDFDPGSGTSSLTSAGIEDIFVSKLDALGNFLWAKSMGGTKSDNGYSIALDGLGNVYTTGAFYGTADFDPGIATSNLTSSVSGAIFISKLDASGNFLWAKNVGGTNSNNTGYSIALDGSGNVYTTGVFQGTADFDPGIGTFTLASAVSGAIFISQLNTSGDFLWAKNLGATNSESAKSIALDGLRNVYIVGAFSGSGDFDPGTGTFTLSSSPQYYDIFIVKLSTLLTNISEENNVEGIKIFPNPFSTQVVLQSSHFLHNAILTLQNCFGQTVLHTENINGQTIVVNRDNLASGLYYVRLTEENKTIATDKLIITNQ